MPKYKLELDREIAAALGWSKDDTALITNFFLDAIKRALLEDGEVSIKGFGRFKLSVYKRSPKVSNLKPHWQKEGQQLIPFPLPDQALRVSFKMSPEFKGFARSLKKCGQKEAPSGKVRSKRRSG